MIKTEALQRSYHTVREKWDPNFEWIVNDTSPWTAVHKPLDQMALALVGTCGAYRQGIDCPFDATNYYGDPSFKEISSDALPAQLSFAHTHYDHTHIDQDANVGFPLNHLLELEHRRLIGQFVNPAISFSGYLPEPRQLLKETAPAAANRLLEAGAEAALLVPC